MCDGRLVVAAELVRQSCVRVDADIAARGVRKRFDVRTQLLGAERAVQSRDQRLPVRDGYPERFRGLAGERATAGVGDRAGDHDRNAPAQPRELGFDRKDRGFGVQRIEYRLDHDQIDAARHQSANRFGIGVDKRDERDVASARIVDVG